MTSVSPSPILRVSSGGMALTDWGDEHCTFTSLALSLPDWHQHASYRDALGHAHAHRLRRACQILGLVFPWPNIQTFIDELTALLPPDCPADAPWFRVRIRLLPGSNGVTCWLDWEPLAQGPNTPKPAQAITGMVVDRPNATVKHPNYQAEMTALATAKTQGWDDIIRLSPEGHLLEGRVSALVLIMPDGRYLSPNPALHACLPSLTLQHLRTHCRIHCTGLNWQLTSLTVQTLQSTPPIGGFLVNAVQGLIPMTRLSLTTYPNGPDWHFNVSQTQTAITRLANALEPSGYHLGTGD